MGRGVDTRAIDAMERACARAGSPDELFDVVADELAKVVPHDASTLFAVDPATMLATAPVRVAGVGSEYCEVFWQGEFHDQDAMLFRDLVRDTSATGALRIVTGDSPTRSPRFRAFMSPQGFDDELRSVFRSGDKPWG